MDLSQQIAAVRGFNRFYTQRIGALNSRFLRSSFSLAELRILHELGVHPGITATDLAESLSLDHGYLSRLLAGLVQKRLVKRTRSTQDKRQMQLSLSAQGLKQQPALEADADAHVAEMLESISPTRRHMLVEAMKRVVRILRADPAAPIIFRQMQLGDAGWIIYRHAVAIAPEFGWNEKFEALCAGILADFINQYQPEWERSWIVEREGEILGSLFLVRQDAETAKLRLLYVEPAARGMGLATKMLEKSIQFARSKSYKRVSLFTTSNNISARRIYQKLGMTLVQEEPSEMFGEMLVGETWVLEL